MTSTIAVIGKSGSGKTTFVKAFCRLLKKKFKDSSILLVDNDLTLELSDSFGIKTRNTIYGIKSGKHDIIINLDENVDLIASWFVTPKDCICPSTRLMRDSLIKLIERYDFVVFDCEYDLKYLNLLVDYPIDETLIVSLCSKTSLSLASKIAESSRKYATDGQLGVIVNKVEKEKLKEINEIAKSLELDIIACVEKYLDNFNETDHNKITEVLENVYSRMNLPQIDEN